MNSIPINASSTAVSQLCCSCIICVFLLLVSKAVLLNILLAGAVSAVDIKLDII